MAYLKLLYPYDYKESPVMKRRMANQGWECILEATLNYEEMAAFRHRYPFYLEADRFELRLKPVNKGD